MKRLMDSAWGWIAIPFLVLFAGFAFVARAVIEVIGRAITRGRRD